MKALTIWQPWASLIMAGAKPYEFRGWRPPRSIIGQRIVIHAGARRMRREEWLDLCYRTVREKDGIYEGDFTCLHASLAHHHLGELKYDSDSVVYSAGLGTAIVGEPRLGTDIAAEFCTDLVNDSDRDDHANWGWPMLDIEVWPEPIPMSGKQGLWNWPTPEDVL